MENKAIAEKTINASSLKTEFPDVGIESYERKFDSVLCDGVVWAAVGCEKHGASELLLLRSDAARETMSSAHIPCTASVSGQPAICQGDDNTLHLTWVEFEDQSWRIAYVKVIGGISAEVEYVSKSSRVCMNPQILYANNNIWVAWSGFDSESGLFEIFVACKGQTRDWSSPFKMNMAGAHSFRPAIASLGEKLLVVCDSAADGKYVIEYQWIDERGTLSNKATKGRANERWLSPTISVCGDGKIYIAWVIVRDVVDSLGIIDHKTGIGFAQITNEGFNYLPEDAAKDDVLAASLWEGLLGGSIYMGYHGLRRRPQITIMPNNEVWLLWELMFEMGFTPDSALLGNGPICGSLAGKRLGGERWGEPRILHNGGINYSIPPYAPAERLAIVYFDQNTAVNEPVYRAKMIDPSKAARLSAPQRRWDRWRPYANVKAQRQRYTTTEGDAKLSLYWADTHVHSVFSPDAEGEPDEIISFARDIAGLDIIAMVDNDFYPYCSMTQLKWKIHNELASIYTQPGKLLVLPGYEYTYHDERFENGFNHRYVLNFDTNGQIFRRIDKGSERIEGLMENLNGKNSLPITHHTTWQLTDYPDDRNVEICSSWRVCIEESDFVNKKLREGCRFGFIGSSDTHRLCPGLGGALTGVYAESLTPDAIYEAYKKHRTIVTQGQRIVIDFRINHLFIGDEGDLCDEPALHIDVQAEEAIEFLEIIRDGVALERYEAMDKSFRMQYQDKRANKGRHSYYIRVKTKGEPSFNIPHGYTDDHEVFFMEGDYPHNFARAKGPFAWSTPIWVNLK